eukprot:SM000031S11564  [mRNA]  locus=s31:295094:298474:- [translate_table: standard]
MAAPSPRLASHTSRAAAASSAPRSRAALKRAPPRRLRVAAASAGAQRRASARLQLAAGCKHTETMPTIMNIIRRGTSLVTQGAVAVAIIVSLPILLPMIILVFLSGSIFLVPTFVISFLGYCIYEASQAQQKVFPVNQRPAKSNVAYLRERIRDDAVQERGKVEAAQGTGASQKREHAAAEQRQRAEAAKTDLRPSDITVTTEGNLRQQVPVLHGRTLVQPLRVVRRPQELRDLRERMRRGTATALPSSQQRSSGPRRVVFIIGPHGVVDVVEMEVSAPEGQLAPARSAPPVQEASIIPSQTACAVIPVVDRPPASQGAPVHDKAQAPARQEPVAESAEKKLREDISSMKKSLGIEPASSQGPLLEEVTRISKRLGVILPILVQPGVPDLQKASAAAAAFQEILGVRERTPVTEDELREDITNVKKVLGMRPTATTGPLVDEVTAVGEQLGTDFPIVAKRKSWTDLRQAASAIVYIKGIIGIDGPPSSQSRRSEE